MSVKNNILRGKYKNHVPYTTEAVPVDEDRMTVTQAREHKANQAVLARKQRDLYREEECRLVELFREDLEKENGLHKHPQAHRVWDWTWGRAHSGGLEEVARDYAELANLVLAFNGIEP